MCLQFYTPKLFWTNRGVFCCSPWSPSCLAGWPPLRASTWTDTGTPSRTWCPSAANPSTSPTPTPSTRTWTTSVGWQRCACQHQGSRGPKELPHRPTSWRACAYQESRGPKEFLQPPWARLQWPVEISVVTLSQKLLLFLLLATPTIPLFLAELQLLCLRTALLSPWWVKMNFPPMKTLLLLLLANNDLQVVKTAQDDAFRLGFVVYSEVRYLTVPEKAACVNNLESYVPILLWLLDLRV